MIVGATGWFPDDILNRLTWQDVLDLEIHWKQHPPIQWLIQGYLAEVHRYGVKKEKTLEERQAEESDHVDFAAFVENLNR